MKTNGWLLHPILIALGISLSSTAPIKGQSILVEDDFASAAGATPDTAKFEWAGDLGYNGAGILYLHTNSSNNTWLRSKASAAPGAGQTLVLQMRAQAYAEGWNPGLYGDKQPRGLRVGSDANNVAEFYSSSNSIVGLRVRKNGVESLGTYNLASSVWEMHDYEISVTPTAVTFKVDGAVAGTFTTNIPTSALNFYAHTYDGGAGNVPVGFDSLSLTLTSPPTKIIGVSGNLAFGDVTMGQTASATMNIANSGNSVLTVTGISYPAGFSGAWSGTIAAGASQSVTVTFSPVAAASYSGTVTVISDATSGGNTVSVSGVGILPPPHLEVEQPTGSAVASGASRDYGNSIVGAPATMTFTIRNTGPSALTGIGVTFAGPAATDFSLVEALASQLPAGDNATFEVRFAPATGGLKSALLQLSSNDPTHAVFEVSLGGRAFSTADDTDTDGMNDAAEFKLSALGFDWQVSQPALVTTYFANTSQNGLVTRAQVQAPHAGYPLLAKDPVSGLFKLTLGIRKSTDLQHFESFPMTAPQAVINAQGELEFPFSSPGSSAFFRLEMK